MKFDKIHLLTLAIAAASGSPMVMASQADSKGFIEDSSLNFLARNMYWNHDKKSGAADNREWGQGFQLQYNSGYTQGTVGFGVDAHAYSVIKLDGGQGYAGSAGVLVPEDDGAADTASTVGAAVKMRVSNTELKYGDLRPYNPVFALADARLMPATATGFMLSSTEIDGLALEAGHFTAGKDFNSTNHKDTFYASYAFPRAGLPQPTSDTVDFFGGAYTINDQMSVSLYASKYEDVWKQYYGNANYTFPLSDDQSINFDFNIYHTDDTGNKLAGDIDNTSFSLAAAYTIGAHTFKLTHQQVHGDTPFDYVGLGRGTNNERTYHDSIYLANSSQLVDFNGPGERSWGVFYNLNMASYGVPGLSFGARYIKGSNVDGSHAPSNSAYAYYTDTNSEDQWERDFDIKYVVQTGTAKDLSLRLRQATHRIGNTDSATSSDQIRLIIEYPYNIF